MIPDNKLLLDVGGTFIKCSDGRSIPIDSAGSREDIVSSLRLAVGDASRFSRVCVAIPGPFDYGKGIFLMKHKFAVVYGENFADIVFPTAAGASEGFSAGEGAPAAVEFRYIHDVNCMLLGEMSYGEGRGCRNVAMIALGTGLGFSMWVDGALLNNDFGSPRVSIYNRPFRGGVLEDYASKRGVMRLYADALGSELPAGITVKDIADRAHAGEKAALDAFSAMGAIIGECIAPMMVEYGIERLLLGGQISRSADLFMPALLEKLAGADCLKKVCPISDFDNATFNGLKAL